MANLANLRSSVRRAVESAHKFDSIRFDIHATFKGVLLKSTFELS